MRLDAKTPPKKPLRQRAPSTPAPKLESRKPRGVSWWLEYAAPDQRAEFAAAARARDAAMQGNPEWQRPEKLGQIGQM